MGNKPFWYMLHCSDTHCSHQESTQCSYQSRWQCIDRVRGLQIVGVIDWNLGRRIQGWWKRVSWWSVMSGFVVLDSEKRVKNDRMDKRDDYFNTGTKNCGESGCRVDVEWEERHGWWIAQRREQRRCTIVFGIVKPYIPWIFDVEINRMGTETMEIERDEYWYYNTKLKALNDREDEQ